MYKTYSEYKKQLHYYPSEAGNIAYVDQGKGRCMLLLHGVPTSSWLYRKIIPVLVEQGYRVIAPDMLGYGSSDKPRGYDMYAAEHTGNRLLGLMNHLNIDAWVQVFHDGGGLWTWEMLKQDASKVDQLIMLNTIVYQEGFKPPLKFKRGIIAKIYSRLYSFRLLQSFVINPTFRNGVNKRAVCTKEMLEGYKLPLQKAGHYAMYYFFTQTCQRIRDYTKLHQSLNIPLSVIWGRHDDMLVWGSIEAKVKENFNLKEDDIHIINGKHFIQEEQAELIGKIILEIMDRQA